MNKKAVIISFEDKPIKVCSVVDFENPEQYKLAKENAQKNLEELVARYENRIHRLECRVQLLEIESRFNRGLIDEKEFKELCGKIL